MKEKQNNISREIALFISHLESLREAFPVSMTVLETAKRRREDDFQKFLNEKGESRKDGDKYSINIKPEHYKEFKTKNSRKERYKMAQILVPRSLFVSMISQYDAYLGRLLRAIFLLKPETITDSEKTFLFKDISQFSSIDDFKEHAVEKEIEVILRKSHEDQFKYMERKFSINLRKELSVWSNFLEITERRNLFVHADGVVSKNYLEVCKQNGISVNNLIEGNSNLIVSQEYFMQSYNCLYEIGLKLGHVLWRKLFPNDKEEADRAFNEASIILIESEEYNLASEILDSACNMWKDKFSTEQYALFATVNCAQSHKWAGRNDKCKEIINKHDFSAKGDEFKLAKLVLNEDWNEAVEIMKKIGNSGAISKSQYKDWPLFKEFRMEDVFLNAYEAIFSHKFENIIEKE